MVLYLNVATGERYTAAELLDLYEASASDKEWYGYHPADGAHWLHDCHRYVAVHAVRPLSWQEQIEAAFGAYQQQQGA